MAERIGKRSTKRPQSASSTGGKSQSRPGSAGRSRQSLKSKPLTRRPQSASHSRRQEEKAEKTAKEGGKSQEKTGLFQAVSKMVLSLMKDHREIEALSLSQKLVRRALVEYGNPSVELYHSLYLMVRLSADLLEAVEHNGSQNDAEMALDFLEIGLSLAEQARHGLGVTEEDEVTVSSGWRTKAAAVCVVLHGAIASLYRHLSSNAENVEAHAIKALELCSPETIRSSKRDLEPKVFQLFLESKAKCDLILCTSLSTRGKHKDALIHAKRAVTLLEPLSQKAKKTSVKHIIPTLGIAYYNVGAELEHLSVADADLMEGKHVESPLRWYQKACKTMERFPGLFSKELRFTFEASLSSQQREISYGTPPSTQVQGKKSPGKRKKLKRKKAKEGAKPEVQAMNETKKLEEIIATLQKRVRMTGTNLDAFLEEIGPKREFGNVQAISKTVFVESVSQFIGHEEASILCSHLVLSLDSRFVALDPFRSILQGGVPSTISIGHESETETPFLPTLLQLMQGKEVEALDIFANLSPQGCQGTVRFGEITQGLEWMHIPLNQLQTENLFKSLNKEYGGSFPVAELVACLEKIVSSVDKGGESKSVDGLVVKGKDNMLFGQQGEEEHEDFQVRLQRQGEEPSEADHRHHGTENNFEEEEEEKPECEDEEPSSFDAMQVWSEDTFNQAMSFNILEVVERYEDQRQTQKRRSQKVVLEPIRSSSAARLSSAKPQSKRVAPGSSLGKAFAQSPAPVTIAGWRLVHNALGTQEILLAEDAKTIKWPPMVREGELTALLESPKRIRAHPSSVQSSKTDSNLKTITRWSAQIQQNYS